MKVNALRGIDLEFGDSEFAAILGPSGCGKTTLLNIIGGLDQYTDGDLLINGRTTKQFREKDWNTYRNHSVGFVFQSYNLIPHQTVLANVELALTLAGVSREERKRRAREALEKVGLGDQLKKKPNEMSGGQMQRVAIARALVNNPDILLADEPTGALDSETSIQVMEILREIAREKLVIMVTHNPDLAETYATRTIRLLDGRVISDTQGKQPVPTPAGNIRQESQRKPSMSFLTALGLSLNNLLTKKGRTILTAFAGSIGIIGIALILSLSNGVNNYILRVQRDVLSSYPLTIDRQTMDMSESLTAMAGADRLEEGHEDGKVYSGGGMTNMMSSWMSSITENDLASFKKWLDDPKTGIGLWTSDIQYEYDTPLTVYRTDTETPMQVNPSTALEASGMMDIMNMAAGTGIQKTMMDNAMRTVNAFDALPDDEELLKSQYEVLAGRMPEAMDEVVVILNSRNELGDLTLYTLGLKDQGELRSQFEQLMKGKPIVSEAVEYNYETLMNMRFRLLVNTDYFQKSGNVWTDERHNAAYMAEKLENSLELRVVGIVRVSDSSVAASTAANGGVGYRRELMDYLIAKVSDSEIVREQMANTDVNVFTGNGFSSGPQDALDLLENMSASDFLTMMEEQGIIPKGVIPDYIRPLVTKELIMENLQEGVLMIEGNTLAGNLETLGVSDADHPSSIRIYPKDFESKSRIADMIDGYNQAAEEEQKIRYTDYVGLLMDSVTTIVNSISYVLIAFVAISLIVSSIMIGIITYISVLERTKEIGILRAIGASRRDISRVFNAETLIIGFCAGVIGIGVTLILVAIMNGILDRITGIGDLASLPPVAALLLVAISMILTLIAGIIPSRIAAKKDPVVALRTE